MPFGIVLVAVGLLVCMAGLVNVQSKPADPTPPPELPLYAGSNSCIECHGKFYQLWSTSRHGLAMPPYTPEMVVEWWGRRDDMPVVFAGCHIVCLPSYYREGLPKVLIEAAACGRPIVTTNVTGCRETVRHGENGLLVPARGPVALAEGLRLLIENQDMRQRMGQRGREIAEAEFSVENVIRETLAVYRGF